ncbi:MAG: response regulator [Bacteroidetes bacterium]|nr:response regulator [Bacteroidota bacterium]
MAQQDSSTGFQHERRRTNDAAPAAHAAPDPAPTDGPRPKLLAVEDNPEMLMLLRHLLSVNWEVHTGVNMETAISEVDANQFEIILMDINLGTQETGVDVLHRIRERAAYRTTPVIAVTAYALPGDRERFLEEGFDDYIGKPFTRQQLFRLLDSIMSRRSADQRQADSGK